MVIYQEKKLRKAQVTVLEAAKKENVIGFLPTNSGKTLIALRLATLFLRGDPSVIQDSNGIKNDLLSKFIVVLAPKVPLVLQHAHTFRQEIPDRILIITGQKREIRPEYPEIVNFDPYRPECWHRLKTNVNKFAENMHNFVSQSHEDIQASNSVIEDMFEDAPPRLLFFTPDLFLQTVEHGFLNSSEISLVVFDECHHYSEASGYNIICKILFESAKYFQHRETRILGLSAVVTNLTLFKSEIPSRAEVESYVKRMQNVYKARVILPPQFAIKTVTSDNSKTDNNNMNVENTNLNSSSDIAIDGNSNVDWMDSKALKPESVPYDLFEDSCKVKFHNSFLVLDNAFNQMEDLLAPLSSCSSTYISANFNRSGLIPQYNEVLIASLNRNNSSSLKYDHLDQNFPSAKISMHVYTLFFKKIASLSSTFSNITPSDDGVGAYLPVGYMQLLKNGLKHFLLAVQSLNDSNNKDVKILFGNIAESWESRLKCMREGVMEFGFWGVISYIDHFYVRQLVEAQLEQVDEASVLSGDDMQCKALFDLFFILIIAFEEVGEVSHSRNNSSNYYFYSDHTDDNKTVFLLELLMNVRQRVENNFRHDFYTGSALYTFVSQDRGSTSNFYHQALTADLNNSHALYNKYSNLIFTPKVIATLRTLLNATLLIKQNAILEFQNCLLHTLRKHSRDCYNKLNMHATTEQDFINSLNLYEELIIIGLNWLVLSRPHCPLCFANFENQKIIHAGAVEFAGGDNLLNTKMLDKILTHHYGMQHNPDNGQVFFSADHAHCQWGKSDKCEANKVALIHAGQADTLGARQEGQGEGMEEWMSRLRKVNLKCIVFVKTRLKCRIMAKLLRILNLFSFRWVTAVNEESPLFNKAAEVVADRSAHSVASFLTHSSSHLNNSRYQNIIINTLSDSKTVHTDVAASKRGVPIVRSQPSHDTPNQAHMSALGELKHLFRISLSNERMQAIKDLNPLLTPHMQQEALKSFRHPIFHSSKNASQVLVATSVVEEGIDVPSCSLVVCFDPPNSIVENIQRRGRARASSFFLKLGGRPYVCLTPCNRPEFQLQIDKLVMTEILLKQVVTDLQDHPYSKFEDKEMDLDDSDFLMDTDENMQHCEKENIESPSMDQLNADILEKEKNVWQSISSGVSTTSDNTIIPTNGIASIIAKSFIFRGYPISHGHKIHFPLIKADEILKNAFRRAGVAVRAHWVKYVVYEDCKQKVKSILNSCLAELKFNPNTKINYSNHYSYDEEVQTENEEDDEFDDDSSEDKHSIQISQISDILNTTHIHNRIKKKAESVSQFSTESLESGRFDKDRAVSDFSVDADTIVQHFGGRKHNGLILADLIPSNSGVFQFYLPKLMNRSAVGAATSLESLKSSESRRTRLLKLVSDLQNSSNRRGLKLMMTTLIEHVKIESQEAERMAREAEIPELNDILSSTEIIIPSYLQNNGNEKKKIKFDDWVTGTKEYIQSFISRIEKLKDSLRVSSSGSSNLNELLAKSKWMKLDIKISDDSLQNMSFEDRFKRACLRVIEMFLLSKSMTVHFTHHRPDMYSQIKKLRQGESHLVSDSWREISFSLLPPLNLVETFFKIQRSFSYTPLRDAKLGSPCITLYPHRMFIRVPSLSSTLMNQLGGLGGWWKLSNAQTLVFALVESAAFLKVERQLIKTYLKRLGERDEFDTDKESIDNLLQVSMTDISDAEINSYIEKMTTKHFKVKLHMHWAQRKQNFEMNNLSFPLKTVSKICTNLKMLKAAINNSLPSSQFSLQESLDKLRTDRLRAGQYIPPLEAERIMLPLVFFLARPFAAQPVQSTSFSDDGWQVNFDAASGASLSLPAYGPPTMINPNGGEELRVECEPIMEEENSCLGSYNYRSIGSLTHHFSTCAEKVHGLKRKALAMNFNFSEFKNLMFFTEKMSRMTKTDVFFPPNTEKVSSALGLLADPIKLLSLPLPANPLKLVNPFVCVGPISTTSNNLCAIDWPSIDAIFQLKDFIHHSPSNPNFLTLYRNCKDEIISFSDVSTERTYLNIPINGDDKLQQNNKNENNFSAQQESSVINSRDENLTEASKANIQAIVKFLTHREQEPIMVRSLYQNWNYSSLSFDNPLTFTPDALEVPVLHEDYLPRYDAEAMKGIESVSGLTLGEYYRHYHIPSFILFESDTDFYLNMDKQRQGVFFFNKMPPIEDDTFQRAASLRELYFRHPQLWNIISEVPFSDEQDQSQVSNEYNGEGDDVHQQTQNTAALNNEKQNQTQAKSSKFDVLSHGFRTNRALPQAMYPIPLTSPMWLQMRFFFPCLHALDVSSKIADLRNFILSLMIKGPYETPDALVGVHPYHPRILQIRRNKYINSADALHSFSQFAAFAKEKQDYDALNFDEMFELSLKAPPTQALNSLQQVIRLNLIEKSSDSIDLLRKQIRAANRSAVNLHPPPANLFPLLAHSEFFPSSFSVGLSEASVSLCMDGSCAPASAFLSPWDGHLSGLFSNRVNVPNSSQALNEKSNSVIFYSRNSPKEPLLDLWLVQEAMTSPATTGTTLASNSGNQHRKKGDHSTNQQLQPESSVSYERLEWLGDSILKLLASLSVFLNLDTPLELEEAMSRLRDECMMSESERLDVEAAKPPNSAHANQVLSLLVQDEGTFTRRRQDLICNAFLELHSKRHGLYSHVNARQMAESRKVIYSMQKSQNLGVKPHADMVEALIGAVFCSNLLPEILQLEAKRLRTQKFPFLPENFGIGVPTCVPSDPLSGKAVNRLGSLFPKCDPYFDQFGIACKAAAAFCDGFLLTNFLVPWLHTEEWSIIAAVDTTRNIGKYFIDQMPISHSHNKVVPDCPLNGGWLPIEALEAAWGQSFVKKDNLWLCRTDESASKYAWRIGGVEVASYQRYEFVGDAILEPLVRYFLYSHFGHLNEKYLDPMRQCLVSNRYLALTVTKRLNRVLKKNPELLGENMALKYAKNEENKEKILIEAICRLPIYYSSALDQTGGTAKKLKIWGYACGINVEQLSGVPNKFSLIDSKEEEEQDAFLMQLARDAALQNVSNPAGNPVGDIEFDFGNDTGQDWYSQLQNLQVIESLNLEMKSKKLEDGKQKEENYNVDLWMPSQHLKWGKEDLLDKRIRDATKIQIDNETSINHISVEESVEADEAQIFDFQMKIAGVLGRIRIKHVNELVDMNSKKRRGFLKWLNRYKISTYDQLKIVIPDASEELIETVFAEQDIFGDDESDHLFEETATLNDKQYQSLPVVDVVEKYPRILADMYESLVFATFVDAKFDMTKVWEVIKEDFECALPHLRRALNNTIQREKIVNEYIHGKKTSLPKNNASGLKTANGKFARRNVQHLEKLQTERNKYNFTADN